ncbi:unnamed protein product [Acanthoscelides obtectus]|uniref:Peroxisomal targeting signal 1 receptor n=1 Tax=Acanthoscelides obtectus TaxID=200917 RepID=A0A9P0KBI4_ACAOB|nr:unnamed protein product [Acanthoscelides obtectus]CAH2013400.1 unnamed protein product [Acanthoscelides obtectus]CAK1645565.1 Peroxisomal targeting signal 1 receptor [Acanthoscelides obtectus]CAK1645946.1 Peroxisomal targeting signal 1 receptor [Acanthoscelides obtectus]
MAFRQLTEAECGQANPLQRLTSHITSDHTFADSHGQLFQTNSDQLVEQFLQETRALPQTFRMDDLMREMHEIESQRSVLPPVPASTVKDQLHDVQEGAWAQQYIEDGKKFDEGVNGNEAVWAEILSQEKSEHDFMSLTNAWNHEILNAEAALSEDQLDSTNEDSKFVYSKFMKFMKTEQDTQVDVGGGKLTEAEAEAWTKEYFDDKVQEDADSLLARKWAEEHVKTKDDDYNSTFWDQFQEDMKKTAELGNDAPHPWMDEFNTYYNTPPKEYEFSDENPMLETPKPLEKGKQFLEEGDFPSAVLCFEAAVKQESNNAEAWLLLGTTQAENEQDPQAIAALNKCLELEPTDLRALMALAVCYTNESYYNQACLALLNWLKYNPKYKDLVESGDLRISGSQHKQVQDLFIKAAQRNPKDIDYEIQCGLGVLFNLSGEYNKAADCFTAALSVKPDDARLWNRLGATLANGSRPEEAVDAYHHALNIVPGFIRARYNVGITCINLNAYRYVDMFCFLPLYHDISYIFT